MDISNAFRFACTTVTCSVVHRFLQYVLLCTNDRSAIHIARNLVFDKENMHIEGDCNFLQEKIQDGAIVTYHVKSVPQLTDSLSEAFCNSLCIVIRDEFHAIDIRKPNI